MNHLPSTMDEAKTKVETEEMDGGSEEDTTDESNTAVTTKRRAMSNGQREDIIILHSANWQPTDIANQLGLKPTTVRTFISRINAGGPIHRAYQGNPTLNALTDEQREALVRTATENRGDSLSQISAKAASETGRQISRHTISKVLKEKGVARAPAAPSSSSGQTTNRKRKSSSKAEEEEVQSSQSGPSLTHAMVYHQFHPPQIIALRASLLSWYDENRRRLPWRGDYSMSFGLAELKERAKAKNAATLKGFLTHESNPPAGAAAATAILSSEAASPNVSIAGPSPTPFPTIFTAHPVSAYGVWVSEIMLQQTRVDTVIDYWTRWMARFPTIADLAKATIEEVNQLWAGLGYYRRAKFLLQGAQALMEKYHGVMPQTVEGLLSIPGIGPYTAGAIASIAFQVPSPLVDGNVIRVLSRLRAVDVDPKNRAAQPLMWQLASSIVDPRRPGDFNQALMELGATVCTPVNPQCAICPVRPQCYVHREVHQHKRPCDIDAVELGTAPTGTSAQIVIDIEEAASPSVAASSSSSASAAVSKSSKAKSKLPLDHFSSRTAACTICDHRSAPPTSVADYPSKATKKAAVEQHLTVTVLKRPATEKEASVDPTDRYLLVKRPSSGLLAGQLEFPSLHTASSDVSTESRRTALIQFLAVQFDLPSSVLEQSLAPLRPIGQLVHIFSHRKHHMTVFTSSINNLPASALTDRSIPDEPSVTAEPARKKAKTSLAAAAGGKTSSTTKTKSAIKKTTNNDDEEEEEKEDESDSDDTESPLTQQSYRWVTLSQLQEDHKAEQASELALTTGQRKVVKLLATAVTQKSLSTSSKRKNAAAAAVPVDADTDGTLMELDDTEERKESPKVIELDESDDDAVQVKSTSDKKPSKAKASSSSSASGKKTQSNSANDAKTQPSLMSFFGAPNLKR